MFAEGIQTINFSAHPHREPVIKTVRQLYSAVAESERIRTGSDKITQALQQKLADRVGETAAALTAELPKSHQSMADPELQQQKLSEKVHAAFVEFQYYADLTERLQQVSHDLGQVCALFNRKGSAPG